MMKYRTSSLVYDPPQVFHRIGLEAETPLLTASVTEALIEGGVDTMSQEYEEFNFDNTEFFTHDWQ